ncbi:hypothetical protein FKM82_003525 [Ascaphus truei]
MASMITAMYQQVQALPNQMALLTQQVQDISFQAPPVAAPPLLPEPVSTATSCPKIPAPKPYAGDPHACRGFLKIQFEMAPQQYSTGRKKVAYACSLLTGKALASPIWELRPDITHDYAAFRRDFRQVFDTPAHQETASDSLLELSQGRYSVAQYALEFRTIAAETQWGQEALVSVFWRGLTDSVKDELTSQPRPGLLEGLISQANRVDQRLQVCRVQHQLSRFMPFRAPFPRFSPTPGPTFSPVPALEAPEPMQLGFQRSWTPIQQARQTGGLCYYCGSSEHLVREYPLRPGNDQTQVLPSAPPLRHLSTPAREEISWTKPSLNRKQGDDWKVESQKAPKKTPTAHQNKELKTFIKDYIKKKMRTNKKLLHNNPTRFRHLSALSQGE